MRFMTKKKIRKVIEEAVYDAIKKTEQESYDKGYRDGFHKGLTSEKKGVFINNNGMYIFGGELDLGATHNEQPPYNHL